MVCSTHITTVHPPFDIRIFHREAKTLVREGYDVALIAQHERNEVVDGVRIIALSRPRTRLHRMLVLTPQAFLLAKRQKADVYHFHDPELLFSGLMLKIFARAKVVYDVHEDVVKDVLTKYWIPTFLRRAAAFLSGMVERTIAQLLDARVAATEDIARSFRRSGTTVIHNYPDLSMLPKATRSMSGEKGTFVLAYVGGINRIRGAVEMIRALEYLSVTRRIRLDLIGEFETPEVQKRLETLEGFRHVRYLGRLPWASAWSHAQHSQAGLILFHPGPNHTASLPNKLFEYMAAGLPVIASNFPIWKALVENNHCGITVDPLKPKEIARAVQFLLTYPKEARRMGTNGRKAVIEKYNWEKEGEKLLRLYDRLVER